MQKWITNLLSGQTGNLLLLSDPSPHKVSESSLYDLEEK